MKTKTSNKLIVCLAAALICGVGSICAPFASLSASAEETDVRYDNAAIYSGEVTPYLSTVGSETINFTSKEETFVELTNQVPLYQAPVSLENCCGCVGGAIVVGFYDKYYEELIPSFTAYYPATGKYKRVDSVYVPAVINELYTLMRTNVDDVGVSEADCKDGLQQYFSDRGRDLSYSSVKSWGSLSQSKYLDAINNNKPVLLFCDSSVLLRSVMYMSDTSDSITTASITSNHVMVGYGLYTVKYYNGTNNFRTDTYVMAASGLDLMETVYVRLDTSSWLNSAYEINVS